MLKGGKMPYQTAYSRSPKIKEEDKNKPKTLATALVHSKPKDKKEVDAAYGQRVYKSIDKNPPKSLLRRLRDPAFLMPYLTSLSLFLKAEGERKMREYRPSLSEDEKEQLTGKKMTDLATEISQSIKNHNINKHKRLAAGVTNAKKPYEALAVFAKFYPLSGISQDAIDKLIGCLEEYQFQSVKDLLALSLLFYEANA